ncbi:MAG: hypothetical protein PHS32_03460 [Rhodoferax sp.]|uniref:hypothetical protein n=1 Tax=Rhodoferax sp. TaxID=50421 RepID=UPI0026181CD1|nr:hypothetical protein [Rhodoferax sp.]MDD5332780.1 hypothetical protein [Rhodoferax sp.]
MNAKPNPLSKASKAKSLLAAVTIAVGLQGVLLWQMNEVASSGAQSAQLAARAAAPATGPAQATPSPTTLLTLEPVMIVARREAKISDWKVASVNQQAASSVVDRAANAM